MRKLLKIFILLLLILFSTSCSHYHNVKSEIYFSNLTGKGNHVILLYVNSTQVDGESLDSVQAKILPVLQSNKPIDDMVIDSWIESSTLYFSFTYNFENIKDFERKAELITGNSYDFANVKTADPFYHVVTFSGLDIDESDFSYWAVKAIEDADLFSYSNLTGSTTSSGTTIYFENSQVSSYGGVFRVTNIWRIENLFITTKLDKQRLIERDISIQVDESLLTLEQSKIVEEGQVKDYFQAKLDKYKDVEGLSISEAEQITEDGLVKFNIKVSSSSPDQINIITEEILLGFDATLTINYDEETKIANYTEVIYSESDGYKNALQSREITYTLDLEHYNLISVSDEPYDEENVYNFEYNEDKIIYVGNLINLDFGIKYDAFLENLLLGLGAALLLGILIIAYTLYRKKHPKKPKEVQETTKGSVEVLAIAPLANQFIVTQIFEDAVEITTPENEKKIVSIKDMYDNPQLNDVVEIFGDELACVVVKVETPIVVPSKPGPKVENNPYFKIIEINDEHVIISKDGVDKIQVNRDDAYDNPNVDDVVELFGDEQAYVVVKVETTKGSPSKPGPKKEVNTHFKIVEINDEHVIISKDGVDKIQIKREDAYDDPNVDDVVDYFTDEVTHMIAKK